MSRPQVPGWAESVAEAVIVVSSLVYVIGGQLWSLVTWESLAVAYLAVGLFFAWPATHDDSGDVRAMQELRRWAWVLPVVSSVAGAYSAVLALVARSHLQQNVESGVLAVAACLGVVLSWSLLSVGFAQIYLAVDASEPESSRIDFPGQSNRSMLAYLYFAFTVSASFATSDSDVRSIRVRRLVMLHSILCFFYNALVLAVSFQVLQQVISG
ncbi:MAG TPA: DUF1345 domain-containing protein [Nocardioides sp.]|nr:DUF1345 domain-containing protein [Nocardioides sp.]